MKCNACNNELNFPEGVLKQLTVCPFCKAPLKVGNLEETKSDLLKDLVNKHGKDLCSDSRSDELRSLLASVPKEFAEQRNILVLFSEYNLLSRIYESINSSANDRKSEIKEAVESLYKFFGIPVTKGLQMTLWVADGLGINISSINEKSLNIYPLSKVVANVISDLGIYRFGSSQSIDDVLENCKNGIDVRNFIIMLRMGVVKVLKDALGETAENKSKAFMEAVNILKDIFIPEATAIRMVRSLAEGMNFSLENEKFVDPRDGQVYRVVKIGNQTWLAENFRFKCSNSFAYCDQEKNVAKQGRLYTLAAARQACPPGWHLPSREEAIALVRYVCEENLVSSGEVDWDDEDKISKILMLCLCPKDARGCKDYFGFSAVSGGCRKREGYSWLYEGVDGGFEYWTSTKPDSERGCGLTFGSDDFFCKFSTPSDWAYPVRYIKNKKG